MLTTDSVKALVPPPKGSKITYDRADGDDPTEVVLGFGCRVTAAGAKSLILNYRNRAGVERRYTIGSWPQVSVRRGRKKAGDIRSKIKDGYDPVAEETEERQAPTVRDLAKRAVEEHFSTKRLAYRRDVYGGRVEKKKIDGVEKEVATTTIDGGQLKLWILPELGSLKVADVRPGDIKAFHRKVSKTAPYRANRCVSTISKMMSLAIGWEYRTTNPCKNAIDRNPETKRKVYLKPEEIARLSQALAAYPNQNIADAIRLLLLTGARKMEVQRAHWDQFRDGLWVKPGSTTKQTTEHEIPLSGPALQLLAKRRETAKTEYVFPGRGVPHLKEIKSAWAKIRKAAGLDDVRVRVRVHDLRHTSASILVSGGYSLPLIGGLLGHTQASTTQRYAHLMSDPLREAAERLGAVVTGNKSAEVVKLPKRHPA
jgi:integrase